MTRRSVYAVGRPQVDRLGELMAAVLACGPYAVLSHESAAEVWQLLPQRSNPIHVTLVASWARRVPGIAVHRRVALEPDRDITTEHRIPVTTPVCTVIDLATRHPAAVIERMINEGDKRDLFTPETLRQELDARPGLSGVGTLRGLLDRHTLLLTDSELERLLIPLAERAGLPRPQTQAWVNGFRVDFYWPDLPLIVETDGLRYHRTPTQQARDHLRDQAHAMADIERIRFTHAQVRYDPAHVVSVLSAVATRLLS